MFQESKKRVQEDVEVLRNDLQDLAYHAGENIRSYFVSRKDQLEHVAEEYASAVRNKPIEAGVLSMMVGFLVASLFRR